MYYECLSPKKVRRGCIADHYRDSLPDFVFVGQAARDWGATSTVIVCSGDFPDDEATSDHRPVEAILDPNGESVEVWSARVVVSQLRRRSRAGEIRNFPVLALLQLATTKSFDEGNTRAGSQPLLASLLVLELASGALLSARQRNRFDARIARIRTRWRGSCSEAAHSQRSAPKFRSGLLSCSRVIQLQRRTRNCGSAQKRLGYRRCRATP